MRERLWRNIRENNGREIFIRLVTIWNISCCELRRFECLKSFTGIITHKLTGSLAFLSRTSSFRLSPQSCLYPPYFPLHLAYEPLKKRPGGAKQLQGCVERVACRRAKVRKFIMEQAPTAGRWLGLLVTGHRHSPTRAIASSLVFIPRVLWSPWTFAPPIMYNDRRKVAF